jgi:ATP/ADP translocase
MLLMVGLIGVIQIVICLIDYEFKRMLEISYPDIDLRTATIGNVYALVDIFSLLLGFLSGPILRLFGIPMVLLAVPALLAATLGVYVAMPGFATITTAKIFSKTFDYSIHRVAKEILYIPLGYHEKTLGKAIIDMLTYRVAKGGTGAILVLASPIAWLVVTINVVMIGTWIGLASIITRRFRRKVSREQEMKGF